MAYLNIEYMDGAKEAIFCGEGSRRRVVDGVLELINGDGSYRERGKIRAFPLHNVRRYWTSENAEANY